MQFFLANGVTSQEIRKLYIEYKLKPVAFIKRKVCKTILLELNYVLTYMKIIRLLMWDFWQYMHLGLLLLMWINFNPSMDK